MTTNLNITELEAKVIESLKKSDWFEEMPTSNIKDLAYETKINEKELRGVLSSLVKKEIVVTGEYPNGMTAFHYKG